MLKILVLLIYFFAKGNANECIPRSFGLNRIVCVCNATYCDGLPNEEPNVPQDGSSFWYVSNRAGLRLKRTTVTFKTCQNSLLDVQLSLDPSKTYQRILGFGGAFTDSTGINIKKLSEGAQKQIIRTYYHPKTGSRYTIGRIPIGGTDFSTRPYTYDDVNGDVHLKNFSLQYEDYNYKIPFAKEALQLNSEVKFFSSSWSAPPWMKTNDRINGFGFLRREFYQTYANYLLRFLREYKKNGLNMWAITTGNEPFDTYIPFDTLNTMGWTPYTMAQWVGNNLGPTLAKFNNSTAILALDDQRFNLPWYMDGVYSDKKAQTYIIGTAVHWYGDPITSADVLDETHYNNPDKIILMTEACTGYLPLDTKVVLGSWDRGEQYMRSILEYLNHWAVGWVDWNLALDKQGGPNWINNFVDSPIIVNPETDEFFKQPMYYALKHFSRFIDRDSIRISITATDSSLQYTAVVTPSKEVVVILYNGADVSRSVSIRDPQKGCLHLELSPYSMNTLKYRQ
ncbi:lysosomal acid glucosylceramidase-like [Calliopsis andreniformis]|uniref:lysosomal acid glucosylceramidase-like n=1 Tax=Calliopsis andreniformis TaxID=337506 RepID=UPI003FCECF4E